MNDPLIKKRYLTHRLPGMILWSKNVTLLTRGAKWPFRCLDAFILKVTGYLGLSLFTCSTRFSSFMMLTRFAIFTRFTIYTYSVPTSPDVLVGFQIMAIQILMDVMDQYKLSLRPNRFKMEQKCFLKSRWTNDWFVFFLVTLWKQQL